MSWPTRGRIGLDRTSPDFLFDRVRAPEREIRRRERAMKGRRQIGILFCGLSTLITISIILVIAYNNVCIKGKRGDPLDIRDAAAVPGPALRTHT